MSDEEALTEDQHRKLLNVVTHTAPKGLMGSYLAKLPKDGIPSKAGASQVVGKKRSRKPDSRAAGEEAKSLEGPARVKRRKTLRSKDEFAEQNQGQQPTEAVTTEEETAPLTASELRKSKKQKQVSSQPLLRMSDSDKQRAKDDPLVPPSEEPQSQNKRKEGSRKPPRAAPRTPENKDPEQQAGPQAPRSALKKKPSAIKKASSRKQTPKADLEAISPRRRSTRHTIAEKEETTPKNTAEAKKDKWMKGLSDKKPKQQWSDSDAPYARTRAAQIAEGSEIGLQKGAKRPVQKDAAQKGKKQVKGSAGEDPPVAVFAGTGENQIEGQYYFASNQIQITMDDEESLVGPNIFLRLANVSGEWRDDIFITAQVDWEAEQTLGAWLEAACQVCKKPTDADKMLICDKCELNFHTNCLDPPLESIPDDDWYCPKCKK